MARYNLDRLATGLSSAVVAGMTPVLSYWSASDMRWLDSAYYPDPYDGSGADPCPWDAAGRKGYPADDNQDVCGAAVSFSDFQIADGPAPPAPGPSPSPPAPAPPSPSKCAAAYAQCGGTNWHGPTCCVGGFSCDRSQPSYQQCKPSSSKRLSLEQAWAAAPLVEEA